MKKSLFLILFLVFNNFLHYAVGSKSNAMIPVTKVNNSKTFNKLTIHHGNETNLPIDYTFSNWKNNPACVKWVDSVFEKLTWEQRVSQFFMIAAYTAGENYNMEKVEALVRDNKAGAVIFFKGNPYAEAYWTNRIQAAATTPVMVGIDGEWGLSMRLDSTLVWPRQLTLGAISNESLIYKMGEQIGYECKRIGINVNFAPDVDINTNPNNPVINDRSFGEDKLRVAHKGLEYGLGMQHVGVLACAKHFPGHGNTDKDSHLTLPSVNKSKEDLMDQELYPFQIAFKNGIGSAMVAHLNIPSLDSTKNSSSSLSKKIITGLLKNELGFEGLIFSDALNMKGVSSAYAPGVVDSIAFMAGNDILVFSENSALGIKKIIAAKDNGSITENDLADRVKKVLAYKYLLGLHAFKPIDLNSIYEDLNTVQNNVLIQKLYNNAITIANNEEQILPLKTVDEKHTAAVSIDCKEISSFQNYVNLFTKADLYNIPNEGEVELNKIASKLEGYERVIIDMHGMSRYAAKNYGMSAATTAFVEKLAKKTQVILVLFGSPYSLKYFNETKNIIVAYEDNEYTQKAAANVLFGGLPAVGKLPVSASMKFPVGKGFISDTITRLQIASPEEAGLYTSYFNDLTDIAFEGVLAKAYPGCQVLVAKDGKVIWNKTYGTKIYEESKKASPTLLYDLASITKVAATTMSVMKLFDEGKIKLEDKVSDYLTLDDSATIKDIQIKDLLTHHSGLKPFIEFYRNTIDTNYNKFYSNQYAPDFQTQIADNMYIRNDVHENMWQQIAHSELKPNKTYVYSDLNFYTLQKIVEYITQKPLDRYVAETFYKPMGLTRMQYLPLNNFSKEEIAPTENDKLFRKQVVQGFVHDPGAAMYGGVAGHAGVFSNAFDLAQLMQMLLNKGTYNGVRFFSPATVDLFTAQFDKRSRRGLGFDKPEPNADKGSPTWEGTPKAVFGHTGFTGNSVWVDPTTQMTFVFLSNRVYPNAENPRLVKMGIRTNLQKAIYKAMEKSWVVE